MALSYLQGILGMRQRKGACSNTVWTHSHLIHLIFFYHFLFKMVMAGQPEVEQKVMMMEYNRPGYKKLYCSNSNIANTQVIPNINYIWEVLLWYKKNMYLNTHKGISMTSNWLRTAEEIPPKPYYFSRNITLYCPSVLQCSYLLHIAPTFLTKHY